MMQYLRIFGVILASVTVALAPQYAHYIWYTILFGVSNGLALVLPSVFPQAKPAPPSAVAVKAAAYDALQTKG